MIRSILRPSNLLRARLLCVAGLLALLTSIAHSGERVRVGVLNFGTVSWELDVIQHHGLAEREDVDLEVTPLGSTNAVAVALQGDGVDVIVKDWIWVSRQRADGRAYAFVPYSLAVGALMVRPDSDILEIADLAGKRLGIAGGPVDKSWLLLRAYAKQESGTDLADLVEPSFGAPPLINKLMLKGDLDAAINFWHYAARLDAAGMKPLVQISELLPALGVQEPIPLLGWVFHESWAAENGNAIRGFLSASRAAKRILDESDAEWERIRPLTGAEDEQTLHALRDAYRAGIPMIFGSAQREAAAGAFAILAREGGEKLVGSSSRLSPGTFWDGFEVKPWR